MTDDLRSLGSWVAWPPAPDVAGRLDFGPRRARRRGLVVAVAVAVLAITVAMAVPQARSSILRFLHLGGVTIERVSTLPSAQERPLSAGLGQPVSAADAERALGTPFRGPRGALYERDGIVSTVLAAHEPVLLSEFGSAGIMNKFLSVSHVRRVEIAPGVEGILISGAEHVVFFFPTASPRLAGNALIWVSGGVTFRLEGRSLQPDDALGLARRILGTPSS